MSGRRQASDDDIETPQEATQAWGTDDDGPIKEVAFVSDFAADAPADDIDPVTWGIATSEKLGEVGGTVGVRFAAGGRIVWADAGDQVFAVGARLLVDTERGPRLATVATGPSRKMTRERVRRVLRVATDKDLEGERAGDADTQKALRIAKDAASKYRLPMKVYRVELHGQLGRGAKMNLYYTSDDRLDLRGFIADVSRDTGARVELRQLGVRDEAKAVGGIGSCGLTLCCTTWLPDFVPVSIKMAKDQGLVLSPTKVSGQCGRLKCCLVYEQAGYAELRKGLPKLGKRVVSARGEGRVVEVDVLRQRVRVSYGMGDSEVLPAGDVKPLFAPGGPPQGERGERGPRPERRDRRDDRGRDDRQRDPRAEAPVEVEEERDVDPAQLVGALYTDLDHDEDDAGPTDDPSSMHHVPGDEDLGPTDDPSSLDHVPGGHTGLDSDDSDDP
jgi:cell fate regulator YaaT (PSP1 superfamily)